MMRHLFKLVWNRKRTNALIILEIFFSFLVVFVVSTLGLYVWDNVHQPLGFDYRDVWSVNIDRHELAQAQEPLQAGTFPRLVTEAKALAPVESAAGLVIIPYSTSDYQSNVNVKGREIQATYNEVTEDFAKVMGVQVAQGRWFEKADEALAWRPAVINLAMARAVFGDADPIGKPLGEPGKDSKEPEKRVIGVIREYKKGGELSGADRDVFLLKQPEEAVSRPGPASEGLPFNLVVKVRPGTPVTFEEELAKRLQAVAPAWSFEVKPLSQMRDSSFKVRLTPLITGGIVALFLMLMVGLGLIGVLWQNLLQRTREMGLRRATGASRASIHSQVIAEQLILTSLGVTVGIVLVAQIPVLDLVSFISGRVFAGGLLFSTVTLYLLSLACALYPSTLAAKVAPADALRYE
jgi:putative ABC transport system permease protein